MFAGKGMFWLRDAGMIVVSSMLLIGRRISLGHQQLRRSRSLHRNYRRRKHLSRRFWRLWA